MGEDFSVVRSIHRITRQGGTKTLFEPERSCRVAKHGSDLRWFTRIRRLDRMPHAVPSPVFKTASGVGIVSSFIASGRGCSK